MRVKPMCDRVLVKQKEAAAESKGGIVIPEAHREAPSEGVVLEVGTITKEHFKVEVGDFVLFETYTTTDIIVDGEKLMIVSIESILAILDFDDDDTDEARTLRCKKCRARREEKKSESDN